MLKSFKVVSLIGKTLGKAFANFSLSPNAYTLLSIVFAFIGFLFIANRNFSIAIMFFLISGFLDWVDGAVAREKKQESRLGAYLDGVSDRIVEFLLVFGLIIFGISDFLIKGYLWGVLLLFFGTAMTSFSKAYALYRGVLNEKKVRGMPGLLERAERLLLIFLGMVLWHFDSIYLTYMLILASILSIFTFLQRVYFTFTYAKDA